MTPWDEWWGMALKDDSNPQIALLPLHPDVRARFNESAAWDFARSMYGKPYGYHNMIFSWIDTMSDNYPPPLDANLVLLCLGNWDKLGNKCFTFFYASWLSQLGSSCSSISNLNSCWLFTFLCSN